MEKAIVKTKGTTGPVRLSGVIISVAPTILGVSGLYRIFTGSGNVDTLFLGDIRSERLLTVILVVILTSFVLAGGLACLKLFRSIAFYGFRHGGLFGMLTCFFTFLAALFLVLSLPAVYTGYAYMQWKKRCEEAEYREEQRRTREEVRQKVGDIHETVQEMDQKLDHVVSFLEKDLGDALKREREQLGMILEKEREREAKEARIDEFIRNVSDYIDRHLAEIADERMIHEEEALLKELFGAMWNKLEPSTRTSLVSASVIWSALANVRAGVLDYSGVCISAVCALENELRKYFFDGFIRYETERYGMPNSNKDDWHRTAEQWTPALISQDKLRKAENNQYKGELVFDRFELGNLQYLLRPKHDKNVERTRRDRAVRELQDYLRTILADPDAEHPDRVFKDGKEGEPGFLRQVEIIREQYRNKTAHAGTVTRNEAEGCYRAVIYDPELRLVSREEAYRRNREVMGALYRLMTLVA